MSDKVTDSKDFPPHYKAAVDKANIKIKEGVKTILAICGEQTTSAGKDLTYRLKIDPDIEVLITQKKGPRHGI